MLNEIITQTKLLPLRDLYRLEREIEEQIKEKEHEEETNYQIMIPEWD